MALRSAPLSLLVLVMVALRESCFGTSSHSLKYFSTAISEPSQGQPHFIAVGYLDDQVFVRYDSNSQRMKPQVSWMEKVGKEDPKYWDTESKTSSLSEQTFRRSLENMRERYNHSEGLHTLQRMYGCELFADGSKGGFDQHGYDGSTYIIFDPETLTWVAPNNLGQMTQRKWDALSGWNQGEKTYLEETCIEWLEKYLSYKMETLQRTETPKVTMSRRTETEDGMETHVCRMDGFYPREIDASWRRDGEVWLQDTLRGFVVPNADGTYHYWLSIRIDPKERDRYRCHVEHDSLQEPLDMALKGASSHSLKYFDISISDPSLAQPHFVTMGYLDGQVFVRYDSHSRRMKPRVSWMEKLGKEDPQYWDTQTQIVRGAEETFRDNLEILRNRYNQSEGLHTVQRMFGCELQRDGSKGGFFQYGYEGKTFISFDKKTFTWVASEPQAQITKRKWNALQGKNQGKKAYLEEICIEWLKKYLSYGNEMLQKTETPKVTMSRRTEVEDGMETHVCRVHGFYPREIDASWTRDGEVWLQDTFHASVAPNADGTYHYWLSIRIDPKERDRYRCHLEHDSLQEPLNVALKEPKSSMGLIIIISCVVAALVLVGVIAGILVFFKRRQDGYKATPTSDKGSNSSGQVITEPL